MRKPFELSPQSVIYFYFYYYDDDDCPPSPIPFSIIRQPLISPPSIKKDVHNNKHSTIQTTIPLSTCTQRIASLAPSYKSHFPSANNFFASFPRPFSYLVSIDSLANSRGSALPSIPTSSAAQRHTPMKLPFK